MEGEGLVGFVDHGQANAAQMGLVRQLAVFFPTVQGGQWVELAFDRPIGTDDSIGSVEQPNTHDTLQHV
jgi:hypothetical protein